MQATTKIMVLGSKLADATSWHSWDLFDAARWQRCARRNDGTLQHPSGTLAPSWCGLTSPHNDRTLLHPSLLPQPHQLQNLALTNSILKLSGFYRKLQEPCAEKVSAGLFKPFGKSAGCPISLAPCQPSTHGRSFVCARYD